MSPQPPALRWLAWEVTRRCNLACVHCRARAAPGSPESAFDTTRAKRLIDDIAAFAKPVLVLSGGEPLLRHDLFELAAHGTQRGLRMALATNGTLVTDEVCGRIQDSGIRIASLSLDGATAEVHDAFRRQPGAFAAAVKAAEAFRRHGIEFIVNSSFTKRNQKEIPAVCRLAKALGARAWYMFMVVPVGRGRDILDELINPADYEEILQWHCRMEQEEPELLVRPTCAPHYYRIAGQRSLHRRSLFFSTGAAKGCVCAQSICFIDSQGEVWPCSYLPLSAGNARQTPLRRIWEGAELFLKLRDSSSYKGRCGACEHLDVCGGCRARARLMSGDLLGEDPMCGHVPARLRAKG